MMETVTLPTTAGVAITSRLLRKYFHSLVDSIFKILPLREDEEKTLPVYIQSLQSELLGCKELICELHNDPNFLKIASILQYLLDHPDCPVCEVKREVFKAIKICKTMESRYV